MIIEEKYVIIYIVFIYKRKRGENLKLSFKENMEEKTQVEYIKPTFRLIINNLVKDFFSSTKSNDNEEIQKRVEEIQKYQDNARIEKLEKSQQPVKVVARRKENLAKSKKLENGFVKGQQKNGEIISYEERRKDIERKNQRDSKIVDFEESREDSSGRAI